MFDLDLVEVASPKLLTRRSFLLLSLSAGTIAAAGLALFSRKPEATAAPEVPSGPVPDVQIMQFSPAGLPLGMVRVPKMVKSDVQWRRQLSPNAFDISRRADTEMAFTGSYWKFHQAGIYRCVCCDTAVFSSKAKFDSGTGWPSFWEPISRQNISESEDDSFGERTAVACSRCDGHLGHVFSDGPPPTGLRYCINSASLIFRAFAS